MKTVDSRSWVEVLDRSLCLELLRGDEIGRLAVLSGVGPVIFPVNYAMDGDAVVFRTDSGSKLDLGPRAPACFEIDGLDRETRTGWSVVVVGRLEEATPYDGAVLERLQQLPINPWAGGHKEHWVRLVPSRITGRRVSGTAPAS
jgi:nitroimidazol reductase NimA-like FMN-containing flavoprotein (pyridoxamine 5'-phosphate oxidase superfamily)